MIQITYPDKRIFVLNNAPHIWRYCSHVMSLPCWKISKMIFTKITTLYFEVHSKWQISLSTVMGFWYEQRFSDPTVNTRHGKIIISHDLLLDTIIYPCPNHSDDVANGLVFQPPNACVWNYSTRCANALGPISLTIFPSQFKCDGNFILLPSKY